MENINKEQEQDKIIQEMRVKKAKMCIRMLNLENKVGYFIKNDFHSFSNQMRDQTKEMGQHCSKIREHCQQQTDEIKNWIFKGFIVLIASTIILQIILQLFKL